MTVTSPAPEVQRDRFGRPLVVPPGGGKAVAYRRCTTFIDVLDDRYNLELWKQRQVALGLTKRPDLVLKAAASDGDKRELNDVTKQALEAAGSSTAATTGSAVHSLTEQIDRGQTPAIPAEVQGDIDAYKHVTADLTVREIEVFTVHDELKVGGTFDRIFELADGTRVVGDIKTGTVEWGASKIAMQLGMYSRSLIYNLRTGERSDPQVDQRRGLVIHLPAKQGQATLHWVDLEQGWEGVRIAQQVWDWRARKGLLDADPPAGPDIHELIAMCGDVDSLRGLWTTFENQWNDLLTQAAKNRIAELQASSA